MLMKWEDLEVGDEIKMTNEAIDYLSGECNGSRYYDYYIDKVLKVIKIEIYLSRLHIWYSRKGHEVYMEIHTDGTMLTNGKKSSSI